MRLSSAAFCFSPHHSFTCLPFLNLQTLYLCEGIKAITATNHGAFCPRLQDQPMETIPVARRH